MLNSFDNYKIIKEISSGGMATVYLAKDIETNKYVAIKVLHERLLSKEKIYERFVQEGLLKLNHPNIVKVLDIGSNDEGPYIVMEYVDGIDLEELIKQKGKLDLNTALNIFTQILSALSYVHNLGIIHRDIKPKNILIDKDGIAKLTDFGIAKNIYSHIKTSTGGYLGAPAYSSPEQMDGKDIDTTSDIYSLGITLYEMLAGVTPFGSTSIAEIIKSKFTERLTPLVSYRPDLPGYIVSIINKCIFKNPSDRFGSADGLMAVLNKYRYGETIIIDKPTQPIANSTSIKKLGIIFGIAATIMLIVIIVFAVKFVEVSNRPVQITKNSTVGTVDINAPETIAIINTEPEKTQSEITIVEETTVIAEEEAKASLAEDAKILLVIESYIDAVESKDFTEQKKYVAKYALDLVNFKEYEEKQSSGVASNIEREPSRVDKIEGNKAEGYMSFTEHIDSLNASDSYDLITEGKVFLENIDGEWKIIDYIRKDKLISEALFNFKDFSKELKNVKISIDLVLFSIYDKYVTVIYKIENNNDFKIGTSIFSSKIIGPDKNQNSYNSGGMNLFEILPDAITKDTITYQWTDTSAGSFKIFFGNVFNTSSYNDLISELTFNVDLANAIRY